MWLSEKSKWMLQTWAAFLAIAGVARFFFQEPQAETAAEHCHFQISQVSGVPIYKQKDKNKTQKNLTLAYFQLKCKLETVKDHTAC